MVINIPKKSPSSVKPGCTPELLEVEEVEEGEFKVEDAGLEFDNDVSVMLEITGNDKVGLKDARLQNCCARFSPVIT